LISIRDGIKEGDIVDTEELVAFPVMDIVVGAKLIIGRLDVNVVGAEVAVGWLELREAEGSDDGSSVGSLVGSEVATSPVAVRSVSNSTYTAL
jgi:hypothetical protein